MQAIAAIPVLLAAIATIRSLDGMMACRLLFVAINKGHSNHPIVQGIEREGSATWISQ